MNSFFNSVSDFIHSVTTPDRYASQQRSSKASQSAGANSQNRPLYNNDDNQSEMYQASSSYTGGYTNSPSASSSNLAGGAAADRANPYSSRNNSTTNFSASSTSVNKAPYAPGSRSSAIGNNDPAGVTRDSHELQEYVDGQPPAPSVAMSWERIDKWADEHYPELNDQLCYPATASDLNELEADLDCSLPLDVRDSCLIHDGQEKFGRPSGIIFGITLLDLETIAEEWYSWKKAAIRINREIARATGQTPTKQGGIFINPNAGSPNSSTPGSPVASVARQKNISSWLASQDSVPEGAVQLVYAHPGWIPLANDRAGNNIAVDLAPGKKGKWGQVILFGREFDRKYVVAQSWAHFLAMVADDFDRGNWEVDHDTEELWFKTDRGTFVSYFTVLKTRVERQFRHQMQRREHERRQAAAAAQQQQQQQQHHAQGGLHSPSPQHTQSMPAPGLGKPLTSKPAQDLDIVDLNEDTATIKDKGKATMGSALRKTIVDESKTAHTIVEPLEESEEIKGKGKGKEEDVNEAAEKAKVEATEKTKKAAKEAADKEAELKKAAEKAAEEKAKAEKKAAEAREKEEKEAKAAAKAKEEELKKEEVAKAAAKAEEEQKATAAAEAAKAEAKRAAEADASKKVEAEKAAAEESNESKAESEESKVERDLEELKIDEENGNAEEADEEADDDDEDDEEEGDSKEGEETKSTTASKSKSKKKNKKKGKK
ncbi:KNR4/SMI1 [Yarrowia lipolytica]|uniref:KNR4/SMI1 n=1 Tax=Yarrowia lipolytica TaxID=4952 RepID=A0A371CFF0_YARLL|nr:KNR4/SMI1 [Yarrowia lipolytica]